MTRKLELKRFTTYRKKDSETLSFEEELENSNSYDERKQSNKKDLTFKNTKFVNEEIK